VKTTGRPLVAPPWIAVLGRSTRPRVQTPAHARVRITQDSDELQMEQTSALAATAFVCRAFSVVGARSERNGGVEQANRRFVLFNHQLRNPGTFNISVRPVGGNVIRRLGTWETMLRDVDRRVPVTSFTNVSTSIGAVTSRTYLQVGTGYIRRMLRAQPPRERQASISCPIPYGTPVKEIAGHVKDSP